MFAVVVVRPENFERNADTISLEGVKYALMLLLTVEDVLPTMTPDIFTWNFARSIASPGVVIGFLLNNTTSLGTEVRELDHT